MYVQYSLRLDQLPKRAPIESPLAEHATQNDLHPEYENERCVLCTVKHSAEKLSDRG